MRIVVTVVIVKIVVCLGPVHRSSDGDIYLQYNTSVIRAKTNGWANNRDADDLTRHRTHYAVTVMDLCYKNTNPHRISCKNIKQHRKPRSTEFTNAVVDVIIQDHTSRSEFNDRKIVNIEC